MPDLDLSIRPAARFCGWVIGGAVPSSVAADWLTAAWDQNACLSGSSPAAGIVEEVAGAWLKQILGLPAKASFAFVTGCQMAHVTCLAAARHALLERRGWDVGQQGLSGAPKIRIISSDQRHGSFERAVRPLGLGTGNVEYLASDSDVRLPPEALAGALAKNDDPAIVLLQAGEINTGAYDDFAALIPIAHRHHPRGFTWMARSGCGLPRVRGIAHLTRRHGAAARFVGHRRQNG